MVYDEEVKAKKALEKKMKVTEEEECDENDNNFDDLFKYITLVDNVLLKFAFITYRLVPRTKFINYSNG